MRKGIALFAMALLLFAAAAAVGADKRSRYSGAFENGGTMSFQLKKGQNGKFVVNFSWRRLPLKCDDGPETSSSYLEFRQRVEERRFDAEGQDAETGTKVSVRGKLIGARRAEGTIWLRGDDVPVDRGPNDACDSGTVAWSAKED